MSNGLDRSARTSRGKRMSKLLSEEAEADDEFWNQDAFKEDAEDNEYATEDEEVDVFDSDFDDDEPSEDEEEEEEERRPVKKKKLPSGLAKDKKKSDKKKTKSFSAAKEATAPADLAGGVSGKSEQAVASPSESRQVGNQQDPVAVMLDADGERSVRKSTRTAVVIKQAEREAHQAALQALSKPVKKKKEEERKISQEEMLLEAAQTEIQNLQALEVMLAREEEVKHKAIIQKAIYAGPQIRYRSKNGTNVLEFTKVDEFPLTLNSSAIHYPKKVVCVVTGLPAKYRDPKSGLPYATKEAFKIIRDRFDKGDNLRRKDPLEESHHQRKRTKVERERTGSGGRGHVTKLKYKKVNNVTINNDDAATAIHPPPTPTSPKASQVDAEFQNSAHSLETPMQMDPAPSDPASLRNGTNSRQLATNLAGNVFSTLEMPADFVEANEADFMLDDLESLPSNLESGLSLRTTIGMSPGLLDHESAINVPSGDLETQRLDSSAHGEQNQNLFAMPTMLQLPDLGSVGSAVKNVIELSE